MKSVSTKGSQPRHGRRKVQEGNMAMELLASVSRSSGMEKNGDALKDFRVQSEYRDFIQGKLDEFWIRYPRNVTFSGSDPRYAERKNAQENALIWFRKLREGISSSKRNDSFAVEVYETSSFLAVLFECLHQASSIFLHLVPDLYLIVPGPHHRRLPTILISLLHNLVVTYPSQSLFHERLKALPGSLFPEKSPAHVWLSSLSSSLRSRNYVKFEELTRPKAFAHLLDEATKQPATVSTAPSSNSSLCESAFNTLIDKLRTISRNTTWSVIRHAYRELSFRVESEGTRNWLERSLALYPGKSSVSVDQWLEDRAAEGHVRSKDGVEGKYIVCKVR